MKYSAKPLSYFTPSSSVYILLLNIWHLPISFPKPTMHGTFLFSQSTAEQAAEIPPSSPLNYLSQEQKIHTQCSYSPVVLQSYVEWTLIQQRLRKGGKAIFLAHV